MKSLTEQARLRKLAAYKLKLQLAAPNEFCQAYLSEYAGEGRHYVYGSPKSRFILFPLSYTGITRDEIEPASTSGHYLSPIPCPIMTVPLPAFYTTSLRIITKERIGSRVRMIAITDLSSVIAYSMFDISYEGDYLVLPEDKIDVDDKERKRDNEKLTLETENALTSIRGWRFQNSDEWAREMLIRLVSRTLRYEDLPHKHP
jgi:hypothetical protein